MKKEYNFGKGKRGAVVPAPKGKTGITIRIDDDILNGFAVKWTQLAVGIIRL